MTSEHELEQGAGLLHDWRGLPEEHGIAREAKDKIHPTPMGDDLHDLGGGEMTVATDQDMGPGPVAPKSGQQPDQDHGILCPRGPFPWAEASGHQGMRGAFENEQRQIAITLIVMVIEGQFLLAMGRVLRVIEVEDNGSGGGRGSLQ